MKNWANDWNTFAERLVELLDDGATDAEIYTQFRGHTVQWQGRITSVSLDTEWAPGIALSMAEKPYPMAKGKVLSASHIALSIPPEEQQTWFGCEVGETALFTASICEPGLFNEPEISFFRMEDDPQISLRLRLETCTRTNPKPESKNWVKPSPKEVNATLPPIEAGDNPLPIIERLRLRCEESVAAGRFSQVAYIDVQEGIDLLRSRFDYGSWAEALIHLIEDYDQKVDLGVGFPGDLGHAIESGDRETMCQLYRDSLQRKPTGFIVLLADCALSKYGDECGYSLELLRSVMDHPQATADALNNVEEMLQLDDE